MKLEFWSPCRQLALSDQIVFCAWSRVYELEEVDWVSDMNGLFESSQSEDQIVLVKWEASSMEIVETITNHWTSSRNHV